MHRKSSRSAPITSRQRNDQVGFPCRNSSADPACLLGLAAGALPFDDARAFGLIEIDGDESVVRTVFAA